ncbi:putative ankyrin repeat protein [Acanthamoeba polyphaga mimivirus]|nr:putative ankyrin repeat protein [Mimivirus reunion]WMV62167.1 putative ankyrin repeat protein [Mimivirus sp.]WMV63144.1 putative ankyrin repeat protein [Acanthamoeba polyphaga mimivirus]WMV64121.1 putative ankyrin repeat protein [Mimivirus sp.]
MINWLHLPDEIWLLIGNFISDREICCLAFVNTRFLNLLSYNKINQNLVLECAIEVDNIYIINKLIDKTDVNGLKFVMRWSALHGSFQIIKSIIRKDHNNNLLDLHAINWSIESNHLHISKYLIDKYNIVIIPESAFIYGRLDIIDWMFSRQNQNNANKKSTIKKTVDFLKSKFISHDYFYDSMIELACLYGHVHVVQYFIDNQCSVRQKWLYYSCLSGNFDLVKLLCKNGCRIFSNRRLINTAITGGNLDIVRYCLLHSKIDLAQNNFAMKIAIKTGHIGIVRLLVSHGFDIHFDNGECMIIASRGGFANIVKFFLENKVYMSEKVLKIAAIRGYLDIIKVFIKYASACMSNINSVCKSNGSMVVDNHINYIVNITRNFNMRKILIWSLINNRINIVTYLLEIFPKLREILNQIMYQHPEISEKIDLDSLYKN